jgi:tripeptide aminopeptidase
LTTRLGDAERAQLHQTFEALCRIQSPTGQERACAEWITAELSALGLEVAQDDAGHEVGSDAGNLLVRIPGRSGASLLLCAHMDTVPPTAPVVPVLRDGGWENQNDGILGADNKAAVAGLIEVARRLAVSDEAPEVGVELLFTVAEETGLNGAKAFDVGRLDSRFGYVFDHASPLGEIVIASPTYMRVIANIRGRAAHAGLHPELGINAIVAAAFAIVALPQGRLDADTTANVGVIGGGTATNVVAERCRVEVEVRGIDQARVDAVVTEVIDAFEDAADTAACDLDIGVEKMFTGYRVSQSEKSVALAQRALQAIGYEPRMIRTGGGADANAFRVAGFECTNLANGTERAHEPGERVSVEALEANLELMLSLLDQAASVL